MPVSDRQGGSAALAASGTFNYERPPPIEFDGQTKSETARRPQGAISFRRAVRSTGRDQVH